MCPQLQSIITQKVVSEAPPVFVCEGSKYIVKEGPLEEVIEVGWSSEINEGDIRGEELVVLCAVDVLGAEVMGRSHALPVKLTRHEHSPKLLHTYRRSVNKSIKIAPIL